MDWRKGLFRLVVAFTIPWWMYRAYDCYYDMRQRVVVESQGDLTRLGECLHRVSESKLRPDKYFDYCANVSTPSEYRTMAYGERVLRKMFLTYEVLPRLVWFFVPWIVYLMILVVGTWVVAGLKKL